MKTLPLKITSHSRHGNFHHQIIEYRGVSISRQFSDLGDYLVTVEWQGEECDFNSVTGAIRWIDSEFDTDWGFDPVREWGLTVSRAV